MSDRSALIRLLSSYLMTFRLSIPRDPYTSLARVIGEPYDEKKDGRRVDQWLKKNAGR